MTEKEKLLKGLIEKSNKSKEEIEKAIKEKVNELSGLVSEEGAMYILANEMGVRLESERPKTTLPLTKIEEITEPKTPVSLQCKVIRKYDRVNFSSENGNEGSVQSLLVGDESGIIRIVFWNDKAELLDNIQEGDILVVNNAYTRENTNSERIEIHFGQYSNLEVNPSGIEIVLPEYKPINVEFKEKKIKELQEGDRNIKISGIITDFEIPRFYLACPKTFKKVFQDDGKYISPTEGEVTPVKVPIVNVVIDDGTGFIPVVGFRDRAEELTKTNKEDLIGLTEDIEKYREFTKKIVGSKVELGGNVDLNSMSQEKQIIANQIINFEFKTIEEVAENLIDETKSKKNSAEDSKTTKKQVTQTDSDKLDEDIEDIDIEDIDIDDDLL